MIDVISFWVLYGATAYLTFFVVFFCGVHLVQMWLDIVTDNDFKLYRKVDDFIFKFTPFLAKGNNGGLVFLLFISFMMFVVSILLTLITNGDGETLSLHQFISLIAEFLMPCGIYIVLVLGVFIGTNWLNKAYIKFKGLKTKLDKL